MGQVNHIEPFVGRFLDILEAGKAAVWPPRRTFKYSRRAKGISAAPLHHSYERVSVDS